MQKQFEQENVVFSASLKDGGMIVVKENCTRTNAVDNDSEDSSITRPFAHFLSLFTRAGLKIVKYVKQKRFPKELYPVWCFALKPSEKTGDI